MLKNETINSLNQIERLPFTNKIRLWLLDHPSFNPYKFSLKRAYRIITNQIRVLPDFIVIGSSKSGTTSLHYYLIQHPSIIAERNVHFFEYIHQFFHTHHEKLYDLGFLQESVKILQRRKNVSRLRHQELSHLLQM